MDRWGCAERVSVNPYPHPPSIEFSVENQNQHHHVLYYNCVYCITFFYCFRNAINIELFICQLIEITNIKQKITQLEMNEIFAIFSYFDS
jgi:hypothetical protein